MTRPHAVYENLREKERERERKMHSREDIERAARD
jgi:hypothetical protein